MAEQKKATVQCWTDDKDFIATTALALDWSIPKLMRLAVQGLRLMVAGEETADDAAVRMLAKVSGSRTSNTRSTTGSRTTELGRSTTEHNGATPELNAAK